MRAALCVGLLSVIALTPLLAQQTRAERSNYTETSTHADVVAFLDSLDRAAPGRMVRGEVGHSVGGRAIQFVVVSRPLVRTPAAARGSGKPIVYVQGSIHGGEVEGKESLQAILRDLVLSPRPNVLDSIVLIAVPVYNGDGNDALGPQERQRGSQNGPAMVGTRPNGAGLDLNRDYIKVESPEARGSLAFFSAWDPDAFVDLHTTDGSYHGYALTYSPSLHPAAMDGALAPAGPWTRDTLLPEIRRRVRERRGYETFDYGNFVGAFNGRDDPTSLEKGGWETYEHKPRFGTNYYGLRNRVSVLSEAYSHDPFERRVEATTAFVLELLSYLAEQHATVLARTRTPVAALVAARRPKVALRATMTRAPFQAPILVEQLQPTGDSMRHEAGLRSGFRRAHRATAVTMPVWDRFDATLSRALPEAWIFDPAQSAVVERLEAHGIAVTRLRAATTVAGERFAVDSIVRAPRPFQGHQEVRVEGIWSAATLELPAGTIVVSARQASAVLAAILLEPESDDGFTTWNVFDDALAVGAAHPVRRALQPVAPR
ncbi:MAG: M14 family metallopeptidase [Gemmatimonadaceae bacterium]